MATLVIEIDPNIDSQRWRQDFEGVTYILRFCYNAREEMYNFEIYDLDENLIGSNPLVLGQIIFQENPDSRLPPGFFFLTDSTKEGGPADQEKIGRSVFLYYQESTETV
jgi:hypothetical protein